MEENKLKQERVKNFLVVSRPLGRENKIHAEYNTLNGNVRIYFYEGDVAVKAFYDDNNDGIIETMFINNAPYCREDTRKRFLLFFKSQETKELENLFAKAEEEFRGYKTVLNLSNLIAELDAKTMNQPSSK